MSGQFSITHSDLDSVFHSPKRLLITATLSTGASFEFKYLAERLGLSDPDLSRQLSILSNAGMVDTSKKRRTTWVKLTRLGIRAFNDYSKAVQTVLGVEEVNLPDADKLEDDSKN